MIRKEPSPIQGCIRVTFEIPAHVHANRVYLVGDFNGWDALATPLQRMNDGVWRVTLNLPARRRYEFRYLIDNQWWTDTHADGFANGHKNNSLLVTTLPVESLAIRTGHGMIHEENASHQLTFERRQRT